MFLDVKDTFVDAAKDNSVDELRRAIVGALERYCSEIKINEKMDIVWRALAFRLFFTRTKLSGTKGIIVIRRNLHGGWNLNVQISIINRIIIGLVVAALIAILMSGGKIVWEFNLFMFITFTLGVIIDRGMLRSWLHKIIKKQIEKVKSTMKE
ncbi:hypothetical protein KAX97_02240 [candidate division WOR-3 bacterium]|nr:hypothetical protein [candidate division WOR-3 bacterium]